MSDRHEIVAAGLSDYVFGNLPAEQRREAVAHLGECPECRREVEELTLLAHAFARVPEPVPPPAGLKERVLERLEREQRGGRTTGERRTHTPALRRGWHGGWLAAAAAVIVALAGALFLTSIQQRRTAALTARLAAEVSDMRERLSASATQADLAVSILTAGDMRRIEMAGTGGSEARAYWSATRGLLIAAEQLPVPPAGRVYQVWIINRSSAPMSAGLLGAPAGGRGMLIVPPPSGATAGPVTIAVTDEPPGGLPAPSGGKHLVGSL